MDKVVKCLLLDVDNVIISQVEEVGAEIGANLLFIELELAKIDESRPEIGPGMEKVDF